jgi:hypothetical protein
MFLKVIVVPKEVLSNSEVDLRVLLLGGVITADSSLVSTIVSPVVTVLEVPAFTE